MEDVTQEPGELLDIDGTTWGKGVVQFVAENLEPRKGSCDREGLPELVQH